MEPGGSHGLQNRSRPDIVGLGGFDSHALPPRVVGCFVFSYTAMLIARRAVILRFIVVALALAVALVARAPVALAQRSDTLARAVPRIIVDSADSLRPPVTPGRAFAYSLFAPGLGQSVLNRNKAATAFLLVESISLVMIRESAADVHEARRSANDSLITSYVDASGNPVVTKIAPRFGSAEVKTRQAHVEDWIALLIANHLFAGADAFVAAHLWDVKQRLGLRVYPRANGLAASIKW